MIDNLLKYQELDIKMSKLSSQNIVDANMKKERDNYKNLGNEELKKVKILDTKEETVRVYDDLLKTIKLLNKSIGFVNANINQNIENLNLEELNDLLIKCEKIIAIFDSKSERIKKLNQDSNNIVSEYNNIKQNIKKYKKQITQIDTKIEEFKNSKKLELENELKNLEREIPKESMQKYKDVKNHTGLPVITYLNGNACAHCGMQLPTSSLDELNSKKYLQCGDCGKIIIKK